MYKGRRRATGRVVALKFIGKTGKSERDLRNLRQEIEILRDLRHENIIQMLDAFETRTDFVVVTGASLRRRRVSSFFSRPPHPRRPPDNRRRNPPEQPTNE